MVDDDGKELLLIECYDYGMLLDIEWVFFVMLVLVICGVVLLVMFYCDSVGCLYCL